MFDGRERDVSNAVMPEHWAIAAGAHQLIFRHPRAGAQRGDRGAAEIGLSHAPEAGLPPSKAQRTACVLA
jgi:hypothetical protein